MNQETNYSKWYWETIAQTAIKKVMSVCKASDKNFDLTSTEEDFVPLLKYLVEWEKKNGMIVNQIKNELKVIRRINNYEELIAA